MKSGRNISTRCLAGLALILATGLRYISDRRGSIAVPTALMLVILMGFAALALEITGLFLQQRKMQAATDAAVVAAGVPGRTAAQALNEAIAMAGDYGFAHGASGVTVTVRKSNATTAYPLGTTEVILQKPFSPALLGMFIDMPINVRARSVSTAGRRSPGCLMALDTQGAQAITIRNQSSVFNTNCEIVSNSTSPQALKLDIGSKVYGPTFLVGNYILGVNAEIIGRPLVTGGSPPVVDPYASVAFEQAPACTTQSATIKNKDNVTLSPGTFCQGLDIGQNANVVLSPGVYYINNTLAIGNNASVSGTGVTILLNATPQLVLSGGVTMSLSAPMSGVTAGMAIASRRDVTGTFSVNNGAQLNVTGAIYLPTMTASISGNATTTGSNCTQIIAFRLDLASDVQLQADCSGTLVRPIGNTKQSLVE